MKPKEGFWASLNRALLPMVTPVDKWPAMDFAMTAFDRQERMERQNLIIIDLLQQIRDRL